MNAPIQFSAPSYTASGVTATSNALSATPVLGNTLLAIVAVQGSGAARAVSGITDSAGNVNWIKDNSTTTDSDFNTVEVWRLPSLLTTASGFSAVVTLSGNAVTKVILVELPAAADLFDGFFQNTGINSAAQPSTGVFSTKGANNLVLAIMANEGGTSGLTVPAGFTLLTNDTTSGLAVNICYQLVTVAQSSINPTWSGVTSNGNRWVAVGTSYQQAGLYKRILNTVQSQIYNLSLSGMSTVVTAQKWLPRVENNVDILPCVYVCPTESLDFSNVVLANKDDIDFPVLVAIVDNQQANFTSNLDRNTTWMTTILSHFRWQNLSGVPEVTICEPRSSPVFEKDFFESKNLIYMPLLLHFRTRTARG